MISRSRHTTVAEFERMVNRGDFEKSRERIDLIRGELRFMSPAGPEHSDILTYLVEWSVHWAKEYGYSARSEKGVKFLELESLPEPDLVWVKRRRYLKAHPTAADVALAIEVSYSSLEEDRGEMAELYAEAGIPEYWIANCIDSVIEVHRRPVGTSYQERFVVKPSEKVSPLAAPEAWLDVADLFAA